MNKKNKDFIIAGVIALALLIGGVVFAVQAIQNASEKSQAPSTANQEKSVTVEGQIDCVPPKDTSGVQDMSCMMGLKTDDGKYYGLNAADPTKTGSIPTGGRIKVSGILKTDNSKYKTEGIIQVSSIETL